MRISIETVITETRVCGTCCLDEHANPGAQCRCFEEEVQLNVVGDVTPVGDGHVHNASEFISILSIQDDSGHVWSPMEIAELRKDDFDRILDDLWFSYLERAEPRLAVRQELRRVVELLRTHVELGLETGTDTERISSLLKNVKQAVLKVKSREAA